MTEHDAFPEKPLGDGYNLVTGEELAEAYIIRPGFVDPADPDAIRTHPEPITDRTIFQPMDIVMFFDKRSRIPTQDGVNQQAYVIDGERALYVRGIVREIAVSELRSRPEALLVRFVPEPIAPFVVKMLVRYRWRPVMFNFVINFVRVNNYAPILEGSFFPSDVSYNDQQEYERAWDEFVSSLEPDDFLLTFDRRSWISKIIAAGTHGPFSHIAHYMGSGKIWEVVTSGTRIVPLETYKGRHYRVAAYRNYGSQFISREEATAIFESTAGTPGYNYAGAIMAGVRTFFGDKHQAPTTPNGIVLSGGLAFICQV